MLRYFTAVLTLLTLIVFVACDSKDGDTLVNGQVVWADNGTPIAGASVRGSMLSNKLSVKSTRYNEQSVVTDDEGRFVFAFEGDDDVVAIPIHVSIVLGDTAIVGYGQTELDCGDPCEDEEGLKPGRTYDLTLRVPR